MAYRKISPKLKYHHKHKSYISLVLSFLSFFTGIVLILTMVPVKNLFRPPEPLVRLTVPELPAVYLPVPLELPPYATSILGSQPVDPLDVVKYINIEREKVGSKPLRMSTVLMNAAQMRAGIILKYQNFSHQDPYENITLASVLPKLGYHFSYASENIGMGGFSGEQFVEGFMHSTSHRENLLNPALSDTGVGVVFGKFKDYYVNIVVQLFAVPSGKDEYLGYSKDDSEKYKQYLADIDSKLNPIVWKINQFLKIPYYTDEQYRKLAHQRQLLNLIYERMKDEKPLQNEQVAMIMEFNQNL